MLSFVQINFELRELLDLIPGNVCILNDEGEIIYVNPNWEKFYKPGTVANFPGLIVGSDYLTECARWKIISEEQVNGIQSVISGDCQVYETVCPCHYLEQEKWFLLKAVSPSDKKGCMVLKFDVTEKKSAEEKNKINEAILKSLIDNSPALIYMKDMSGKYTHINKMFERITGAKRVGTIGKKPYEVFPWGTADRFVRNDRKVIGDLKPLIAEEQFFVDEQVKTFHSIQFPLRDEGGKPVGIAGISSDISERKRNEGFLFFQNKVLEVMVQEHSLKSVLDHIVSGIEKQTDNLKGSILLLDNVGKSLSHGAAPNLPQPYSEAIDGMSIGPSAGSCGTAAYRKEMVIVSDIASDSLWEDFKELALAHDLQSCWSIPIFDMVKKVLGTFALYSNKPNLPTDWELGMMKSVAHLASLAIEKYGAEEELHKYKVELEEALSVNEERLQLFLEATTDGVWDWNMSTDEVFFSPRWLESLGYQPGELEPHIDSWKKLIHPDDLPKLMTALNAHLEGKSEGYQCENRILQRNGSWRWNLDRGRIVKRSETGKPLRMVGSDTDITNLKEAEFALRASEQNLAQAQEMACLGSWEMEGLPQS